MRSQASSSAGYIVTTFPLEPRGAYLALRMRTAARLGRNLKDIALGTQYSHTRVTISEALSRHADTWIFHPCGGIAVDGGMTISQSPRYSRRQPEGNGSCEIAKPFSMTFPRYGES